MWRILLHFIKCFFSELRIRKNVYQSIANQIHMEMMKLGATEAERENAQDVARYKLRYFRPCVLGGILAMRILFEKKSVSNKRRRKETIRLMLTWLYLSAISDLLDRASPKNSKQENSDILMRSKFLCAVHTCIQKNIYAQTGSEVQRASYNGLLQSFPAYCVHDTSLRSTCEYRVDAPLRRMQKMRIISELMWRALYPDQSVHEMQIQILTAFIARTQMVDDLADLYQDVLLQKYNSSACALLAQYPQEHGMIKCRAVWYSHEKMNPWTLKKFAPKTYHAFRTEYQKMGNVVVNDSYAPACRLIRFFGNVLFFGYPLLRNCIYFFSPQRAVF